MYNRKVKAIGFDNTGSDNNLDNVNNIQTPPSFGHLLYKHRRTEKEEHK